MSLVRPLIIAGLVGLGSAALSPAAVAQAVYRVVGPDGRVTFSDRPPPEAARSATTAASAGSPSGSGLGALPFDLRQVATRFPVTLYSGANCGPCASGKAMLTSRGIPFTERTVSTAEDGEALQRLAGDNSLPLLTVGSQQIKGYSDAEWTQFLDAAGYPKTSQLPGGFRNPPAAPLVAVQRPAALAAQAEAAAAEPSAVAARRNAAPNPAAPPAVSPSNPAGIRF
jgi:glutaredoxin